MTSSLSALANFSFFPLTLPSKSASYVFTIGNFDGFHKGHQLLLRQLTRKAAELSKGHALLVTFENCLKHFPEKERLYSLETKRSLLSHFKIHQVVWLDFEKVRALEYRTFLALLGSQFNFKAFLASRKLKIGVGRRGSASAVKRYLEAGQPTVKTFYCPTLAFDFASGAVFWNSQQKKALPNLSSTILRRKLRRGKVAEVNRALFLPFHLSGRVYRGQQLARKLGFPTANFRYPPELVRLKMGSYITLVEFEKHFFSAVTFVGAANCAPFELSSAARKTIKAEIVESYLFNFNKTVYNKKVRVYFFAFLRDYFPFSGLSQAKTIIHQDVQQAQLFFRKHSPALLKKKIKTIL